MQPIFRYTHLDTPVHRMHPLVKILYVSCTLALVMFPLQEKDLPILLIWLGFSAALWVIARVELKRFATLMKILGATFAFLIISQGLTYTGGNTPLLVFGHLKFWAADLGVVKKEGVWFGLLLCLRILTATSALPLFVMTTRISGIMTAAGRLRVPQTASFMFVSGLSFTSLLFEMWGSIVDAQKLRAFDMDSMNLVKRTVKAYVPIITPLILLLFRKANDFQIAMETKGFGASARPTEIEVLNASKADYAWLVLILAIFAVCTWLKFGR